MSRSSQSSFAAVTGLLSAGRLVLKDALAIVFLAFLIFLNARPAPCQAAAEYGLAVAGAGANVTGLTKKINSTVTPGKELGSTPAPDKKTGSAAPTIEVPDAANQRALEQRAGKDAAKLTLKSVPAKAVVRIDGKTVGQTPLLLTVAPGAYKVEMEGPRMEFGRQQVELHPQETREVELRLSPPPRYPTHIQLRSTPRSESQTVTNPN